MNIRPIKTEEDYEWGLTRINELMNAKPDSKEEAELDVLATLIDRYESENYPIEYPDPIAAIMFRMEQLDLEKKNLEYIFGTRGRTSEIFNKRRPLSLDMIRKLHKDLEVPLEALISVSNGSVMAAKKKHGKFEIYKDESGEFRFRLKNSEGQNLLDSEGYKAKRSCVNGIESIKKNAPLENRFQKKESEGGKFSFSVKAGNNQVIGTSSLYDTAEARDSGIALVKDSAPKAFMEDILK